MNWLQRGTPADSKTEQSRVIVLNVGGVLHLTTDQTLKPLEKHPIFQSILTCKAKMYEDGSYAIDRDGMIFRVILNYLRSNTLCVQETFDEWNLLLEECRFYQIPALEELILRHYRYQRMSFRRGLPHGIYVCWPTTVIVRDVYAKPSAPTAEMRHISNDSLFNINASLDGMQSPSNAESVGVSKGRPRESESMGRGDDNRKTSGRQLAHNALRIVIAPSLPSLEVCADGRSVRYSPPVHECENRIATDKNLSSTVEDGATPSMHVVLIKVEQLVAVLLSAYGYVIQHWNEKEGKIFLSLGPS